MILTDNLGTNDVDSRQDVMHKASTLTTCKPKRTKSSTSSREDTIDNEWHLSLQCSPSKTDSESWKCYPQNTSSRFQNSLKQSCHTSTSERYYSQLASLNTGKALYKSLLSSNRGSSLHPLRKLPQSLQNTILSWNPSSRHFSIPARH